MKMDLQGVEAWRAGTVPPGTYTCRVEDATEGRSSRGYPQLELSWTVLDGEFQDAEIRDWLVVTEKSRGKIVALLQACGMQIPEGEFDLPVSDLVGRSAQVMMRSEPKYDEPEKMVVRAAGYKPAAVGSPVAPVWPNGASAVKDDEVPF
jgi:hypothetical protein